LRKVGVARALLVTGAQADRHCRCEVPRRLRGSG
jgi:hypothetical protein